VSRESADESPARPLETQFERALVIEEVRLGRQ
jgi:hypothetical protein